MSVCFSCQYLPWSNMYLPCMFNLVSFPSFLRCLTTHSAFLVLVWCQTALTWSIWRDHKCMQSKVWWTICCVPWRYQLSWQCIWILVIWRYCSSMMVWPCCPSNICNMLSAQGKAYTNMAFPVREKDRNRGSLHNFWETRKHMCGAHFGLKTKTHGFPVCS